MTIFPNAKINIGLRITGKRSDGYHNIESVFYPVGLRDMLEFVINPESDMDEFIQSGILADCKAKDNLVLRAVEMLRADHNIPALRIHLHKIIPVGAGLGGGSSDAAFMLKYLNRYFKLGLNCKELHSYAIKLGSDCPFFINNTAAIAKGRGEIMEELSIKPNSFFLMIVHPPIQVSTSMAYSLITPEESGKNLKDLISSGLKHWKATISNDFEQVIFKLHPEISDIKDWMYKSGALYSSMSGSGSSVYGIFREKPPAGIAANYWSWTGNL